MRISCLSVDAFILNLRAADNVYLQRVHYDKTTKALTAGARPTSVEVYFQAGAVLDFGEGQALLACGEYCGIDRFTSDKSTEGSDMVAALHAKLEAACTELKLKLLPGILEA